MTFSKTCPLWARFKGMDVVGSEASDVLLELSVLIQYLV